MSKKEIAKQKLTSKPVGKESGKIPVAGSGKIPVGGSGKIPVARSGKMAGSDPKATPSKAKTVALIKEDVC